MNREDVQGKNVSGRGRASCKTLKRKHKWLENEDISVGEQSQCREKKGKIREVRRRGQTTDFIDQYKDIPII